MKKTVIHAFLFLTLNSLFTPLASASFQEQLIFPIETTTINVMARNSQYAVVSIQEGEFYHFVKCSSTYLTATLSEFKFSRDQELDLSRCSNLFDRSFTSQEIKEAFAIQHTEWKDLIYEGTYGASYGAMFGGIIATVPYLMAEYAVGKKQALLKMAALAVPVIGSILGYKAWNRKIEIKFARENLLVFSSLKREIQEHPEIVIRILNRQLIRRYYYL